MKSSYLQLSYGIYAYNPFWQSSLGTGSNGANVQVSPTHD